jgi:hypothetical protein
MQKVTQSMRTVGSGASGDIAIRGGNTVSLKE